MPIKIRLQQVLAENGLDTHGVISRMAEGTGIPRATIQKLYDNGFKNPSLDMLGKVCDWLQYKRVPAASLPHRLICRQPEGPWVTCVGQPHIDLYLGEYRQIDQQRRGTSVRKWIAKRDAATATEIIRILWKTHAEVLATDPDQQQPDINELFVPFRYVAQDGKLKEESDYVEDVAKSKKMLKELQLRKGAAILIGSMRVNYLLEHFMADLFQCEPFAEDSGHHIPIHMMHRPDDFYAPSCFGGPEPPAGFEGEALPGIYFKAPDGHWEQRPWMVKEHDVGVAVTACHSSNSAIRLAVFGYSGRATFTMKKYLRTHAQKIWPPEASARRGWKVGAYIFKLTFKKQSTSGDKSDPDGNEVHSDEQSEVVSDCTIESIDIDVLENALLHAPEVD